MLTRLVRVSKDDVLLVRGPASVKARTRGLTSLGVTVSPSKPVIVRSNKTLPFEAESDSEVVVTVGERGRLALAKGEVGVRIWEAVVDSILESASKKIMIVGETDSGKSTFSTYLINRTLLQGHKPAIIDADVGQADLAPPGCVGSAMVTHPVFDLREIMAQHFAFVGATSPRGVSEFLVEQVAEAIRLLGSHSPDLYIINTDGYIKEGGVRYKVRMVEKLRPDLVLCISEEDSLRDEIRSDEANVEVMRVGAPEKIPKSPSERLERRMMQYRRFLKDAKGFPCDLKLLRISYLGRAFSYDRDMHTSLKDPSVLYVGKNGAETELRVTSSSVDAIQVTKGLSVFDLITLRGMFVSLGSDSTVQGFGVISRVNRNLHASLMTNLPTTFDTIFLSTIRLSKALSEDFTVPVVGSAFLDE